MYDFPFEKQAHIAKRLVWLNGTATPIMLRIYVPSSLTPTLVGHSGRHNKNISKERCAAKTKPKSISF